MTRPIRLILVPILWTAACTADLTALELGPAAPLTTDTLRLNVGDADVSVTWRVDGIEVQDLRDALEVDAERTTRGETWTAQVWGRLDANRETLPDAIFEAVIGNTAPTVTSAAISPEAPKSNEDLEITLAGDDADGDALSWRVEWLRDGEVVKNPDGQTLDADLTTRGETWTAQVWASDGDRESDPTEVSVTIDNVAPVAQRVVINPADAFEDTELIASPTGTDADNDAISWTFAWYVDGVEVDGVTADRLDGVSFSKAQVVTVEATPDDGFVDGAPVLSAATLIGNTPPTATGASIQPAAPTESDTIFCVGEGFVDIDGDVANWQVAWTVDGAAAGTALTLTGADFARDQEIGCTLTPFDGEDTGPSVTAAPVTVLNTAPVLASATIDPAAPVTTDALSAVLGAATDVDEDDVSYAYAWTIDGASAGTDPTLAASAFARDQVIGLTITPTDGTDAGAPVIAAAVTVLNSAPVVSGATLSPTAPATDDAISVAVTAADADADAMTYAYTWSVDGIEVSGETSATLPSSAFVKGEDVSVSVVASDGTDASVAFVSSAVTIVNTAPTLASASLSPSTVREGDTLTCTPDGFDDVDGDSASYDYAWTVDSVDASVTTATLDSSAFNRGQEVVCTVTPTDGTDSGTPVSTSAVEIANTPPALTAVGLSSTTPNTDDDVVATAAGVSDADGDVVSLTWAWTVNGSPARSFTGTSLTDTLPSSATTKNDLVEVTVTPADDADSGTALISATATVQNSAPVITSVTVSPSDVYTATDVTASVSATDADGDSLTPTWVWKVNGSAVSETSDTLASSNFSKDDVVTVEASVSDGADTAGPVTSSGVTVLNTAPVGGSASMTGSTPDDNLVCSVATAPTDVDGDTLTYTVAWELDGAAWTGSVTTGTESGDTISSADTTWGDEWQCFITADDGDDTIEIESTVQGIIPVAPDVERGTTASTTPYRGGTSAVTSTTTDTCGSGEFLVGLQGELVSGNVFAGLATRCAPFEVSCDIDDCIVETGTITTGTMRKGANGDSVETRDCADGQVLTGFVGRSGSITDQLTLRCQPIDVTYDGTSWSADVGTASTDLATMGGTGGGAYSRSDCTSGAAAMQVDHAWNSSGYVGFSLACRVPEAVE